MGKLENTLDRTRTFIKEKLGVPLACVSFIGLLAYAAVSDHKLAEAQGRLQQVYKDAVIVYESNPTPERTDSFQRLLYTTVTDYLRDDHEKGLTSQGWERAFKKAGIKNYEGNMPPKVNDLSVAQLKKIFEAYIY